MWNPGTGNQLLSTSQGDVHNTDTGCCLSGLVCHQESEQPWPWRKLEIVRVERGSSDCETECESTRVLGVQEWCAVPTSCQRISVQCFTAWLRGPWAHTALLAVKPEPCAGLDRVTIVKKAAKVQCLHSAHFSFTWSLLPNKLSQYKTDTHSEAFGAFHQIRLQYHKYKHQDFHI